MPTDADILRQAWDRWHQARGALAQLERGLRGDDFVAQWSAFLDSACVVHNKLLRAFKHGRNKKWVDAKIHERRVDPLLKYMHHARNADQHDGQRVLVREGGGDQLQGGPEGSEIVLRAVYDGRRFNYTAHDQLGRPVPVVQLPETFRLAPVADVGVEYPVPTEHLGHPLADASPVAVARLHLAYLRSMLGEAARLR